MLHRIGKMHQKYEFKTTSGNGPRVLNTERGVRKAHAKRRLRLELAIGR